MYEEDEKPVNDVLNKIIKRKFKTIKEKDKLDEELVKRIQEMQEKQRG